MLALAAIAVLGAVLLTHGKHSAMYQENPGAAGHQRRGHRHPDRRLLRVPDLAPPAVTHVDYDERGGPKPIAGFRRRNNIHGHRQHRPGRRQRRARRGQYHHLAAFDPQVARPQPSTLWFRDDQWKICQSSQQLKPGLAGLPAFWPLWSSARVRSASDTSPRQTSPNTEASNRPAEMRLDPSVAMYWRPVPQELAAPASRSSAGQVIAG